MTRCEPGDVVLIRFPFTDFSESKKRPALVINPSEFHSRHGDVVLLPLTSKDPKSQEGLPMSGWKQAGLLKPTWRKPLVATLSSTFVLRRLGELGSDDRQLVSGALAILVDSEFLGQVTANV